MTIGNNKRWAPQRHLSRTPRFALLAIPPAIAFIVAFAIRSALHQLMPQLPQLVVAVLMLGAAMGTIRLVDDIGRQQLPLPLLLTLAVIFPDQAPKRLSAAMRAASAQGLTLTLDSMNPQRAPAKDVVQLVKTLTEHDRLTRGHSERVRAVTMMIADEMKITGEDRDRLEWGALLHDIGKIEVSPAILNKPGAPDNAEWQALLEHPTKGTLALGEVATWLGDSAHAIDQHHERFDGSGYPARLRGTEISRAARIVAVADAFEVMTANRSYKRAMSPVEARAELAACSGTHFDPKIVRAFASLSVMRLHGLLGPAGWLVALSF